MNVKLRILAILAALALLAAPALANDRGTTNWEKTVADASTELNVKMALLEKIGWDMLTVDVEATGARVALNGEVESKTSVEMAEEVALSVEGVKAVDNHLEMQAKTKDSDTPVADTVGKAELEVKDAILETRVKSALIGELGTNAFDIHVEASDGTVSLRGQLDEPAREKMALQTAEQCQGVHDVIDLLNS